MPNQFNSPEGDLENYFVTEYWLIDQYVGDELLVWGNANYGKLGGNTPDITFIRCTPVTTFAGGNDWKQVDIGNGDTAAIKTDGTLWVWGIESNGKLGTNDAVRRYTPVTTFAGGTNWKQVSVGDYHKAAIKTDGTLWIWGRNNFGELGINATGDRYTPVTTFAGGSDWKQVFCAPINTYAIKTDGTLWVWGYNVFNELAIKATGPRSTPVTTFAGGTNWKQVSDGAAVKTDGTLWTWGYTNAALGTGVVINQNSVSTPVTTFAGGTNWKQVFCRGGYMTAIKTDGTLWTWGSNTNGQLGVNDTITRSTPITTFAGGNDWKRVSSDSRQTVAIKTDGTLWTWGLDDGGSLGLNNQFTTQKNTPVTTFAGGTNWKQASVAISNVAAIFSGTTPDLPIS